MLHVNDYLHCVPRFAHAEVARPAYDLRSTKSHSNGSLEGRGYYESLKRPYIIPNRDVTRYERMEVSLLFIFIFILVTLHFAGVSRMEYVTTRYVRIHRFGAWLHHCPLPGDVPSLPPICLSIFKAYYG